MLNNAEVLEYIDKELSSDDIYQINHYYFNNRKIDLINIINDKLELISKKHNIKILNKQDFQCYIKKKSALVLLMMALRRIMIHLTLLSKVLSSLEKESQHLIGSK